MLWRQKKLVDEQPCNADGDCRIGYIEDGAEEFEVLSADKRHPMWPSGLKQREIEHVDHLSLEEGSIAAFGWEECGNAVVALVEDESVEATVDDVAQGTCQYQYEADDE